jgi:hypothetical protein
MSPKKAIIIVLILFLVAAMTFAILYFKKQIFSPDNGLNANQAGQAGDQSAIKKSQPIKPVEVIEEKVQKIIEDAKQNPTANNPDKVRQEIISTINAEIIKQEQNKTPEQQAADLKAQQERQKIIDQINSQIGQ